MKSILDCNCDLKIIIFYFVEDIDNRGVALALVFIKTAIEAIKYFVFKLFLPIGALMASKRANTIDISMHALQRRRQVLVGGFGISTWIAVLSGGILGYVSKVYRRYNLEQTMVTPRVIVY